MKKLLSFCFLIACLLSSNAFAADANTEANKATTATQTETPQASADSTNKDDTDLPGDGDDTTSLASLYKVKIPDGWQLLQSNEDSGLYYAVYTTTRHDIYVTVVISTNGGMDLKLIAESFATQYKSNRGPSIRNNQASFEYENYEGVNGSAWLRSSGSYYMLITAEGNLRKARNFIKLISSDASSDLVPKP